MTIFTQDTDKKAIRPQIKIYTFTGEEDFVDPENYPRLKEQALEQALASVDAYAIQIKTGSRMKWFVKRGRYGHLYNPIGLYAEGTKKRQLRHAGKSAWEFKAATKKCFHYYIKFLQTKNPAWLKNAEREV